MKKLMLSLCVAACATILHADNLDWAGGDGVWGDPAFWATGVVPGVADTARFQAVGAVQVTADADVDISSMSLVDSLVSFDFGSHTLMLTNSANVSATSKYTGERGLSFTDGLLSVNGRFTMNKQAVVRVFGEGTEAQFLGDQIAISEGASFTLESGSIATNANSVKYEFE